MRTPHDESKLPLWAQGELDRLRRDLAYVEKKLSFGPESKVYADPYSDNPRYLGDHTKIEFVLDSGRIQVSIEDDSVYVYGSQGYLSVLPRSSNTLQIRVGER